MFGVARKCELGSVLASVWELFKVYFPLPLSRSNATNFRSIGILVSVYLFSRNREFFPGLVSAMSDSMETGSVLTNKENTVRCSEVVILSVLG